MKKVRVTYVIEREFKETTTNAFIEKEIFSVVDDLSSQLMLGWKVTWHDGTITNGKENESGIVADAHIISLVNQITPRERTLLAKKLFIDMCTDALYKHALNIETGQIARRILGPDRPTHDDDAEYFALCDAIAQSAFRKVQTAFYNILR